MESAPSDIIPVIVEQPLLLLVTQLTSSNKSPALFRNSRFFNNILNKEFNINTNSMNNFEVEIYVNLMKRFLKDWPHWSRLEFIVTNLTKKNQQEFLDRTLKREYKKLKTYLTKILKQSKTIIEDIVKPEDLNQNAKIIMEINCTRDQLNTLLFQTPQGANKTIFNESDFTPSNIVYIKPSLRSILNWFDVEIFIYTHFFSYTRSNAHTLSHRIINKKVHNTVQKILLDDNIQENSASEITIETESVLKFMLKFKEKLRVLYKDQHCRDMIELVLDLLRRDIQILNMKNIYVQGKYKFSLSKYGYIRYLCKETAENNSKYDIQLEESVSPTNILSINKFEEIANVPMVPNDWLQIKCMLCNVKFNIGSIDNLVTHFMEKHSNEPEWTCTNCLKVFSMTNLTEKDWYHYCLS